MTEADWLRIAREQAAEPPPAAWRVWKSPTEKFAWVARSGEYRTAHWPRAMQMRVLDMNDALCECGVFEEG